jgi:hypothetical protein
LAQFKEIVTVNGILRRLKDAARGKRHEKWRKKLLVSPSRQRSSTPVCFGQGFFLAKNNVTTVEHSPYSPDLTPSDFYLSPSIEIIIKGRRYCDAANII